MEKHHGVTFVPFALTVPSRWAKGLDSGWIGSFQNYPWGTQSPEPTPLYPLVHMLWLPSLLIPPILSPGSCMCLPGPPLACPATSSSKDLILQRMFSCPACPFLQSSALCRAQACPPLKGERSWKLQPVFYFKQKAGTCTSVSTHSQTAGLPTWLGICP